MEYKKNTNYFIRIASCFLMFYLLTNCNRDNYKNVTLEPSTITEQNIYQGEDSDITKDSIYSLTTSFYTINNTSDVYQTEILINNTDYHVRTTQNLFSRNSYSLNSLSWSNDKSSLLFSSDKSGYTYIMLYIQRLNTFHEIPKINDYFEDNPVWGNTNDEILLFIGNSEGLSNLYSYSIKENEMREISIGYDYVIQYVESKNNFRAFTKQNLLDDGTNQVIILDENNNLYWQIPKDESKGMYSSANPIFSPDSKWLLFNGDWLNNSRIYLANLETKKTEILYNPDTTCTQLSPDWSPDGKWISFISDCESGQIGDYEIFIMNFKDRQIIKIDIGIEGKIQDVTWR